MPAPRHDSPGVATLHTPRGARWGPWRRSSYSTGMNNCVEAARSPDRRLAVRDSKHSGHMKTTGDTELPVLDFDGDVWAAFIDAVRDGGLGGNG